jgi:putative sigma-54 modulation protein
MKIQIESSHIEAEDKLKELIHLKLDHLGEKYHLINSCDIVLKREPDSLGKSFFVEAKLAFRKARLFASIHAESFDAAIERIIKNLEHQLGRIKGEREEIW